MNQTLTLTGKWDKTFPKSYADNKELMIIPNAVHTDLYDKTDIIPFEKMESFFRKYLV